MYLKPPMQLDREREKDSKNIEFKRKIITAFDYAGDLIALCNDGSIWRMSANGWKRLPDIPQD